MTNNISPSWGRWRPVRYTWKYITRVTSISVPGWPPGSASSVLREDRYYFWLESWNPDPKKPIPKHTWEHIIVWILNMKHEAAGGLQVKSSLPPGGLNNVEYWIMLLDILEQPSSCPNWKIISFGSYIPSIEYSQQFLRIRILKHIINLQ